MNDPDMGFWQYEYDALGNLKFQSDSRSCMLALTLSLFFGNGLREAPPQRSEGGETLPSVDRSSHAGQ